MNTLEVVQIVEAWAVDTVPDLNSYDHPPEQLDEALPLVMAEVITNAQADANQQLPGMAQYQHTLIRTWSLDLIVLASPDPAWTASHTLYGYVDALGQAVTDGVRLGDNVVMSQFYTASYDPPEVEYGDGTIARQVTFRITVGEMIGVT